MSTYEDKKIICTCGKEFVWLKGEQNFMQTLLENGVIAILEPPRRCKPCREERKKLKK